jgi:hypothetical protein
MASSLRSGLQRLRFLADPLFWFPFLVCAVVKLIVYQMAVVSWVGHGFAYYFGMSFSVVEAYGDFSAYYVPFVTQFLQGNLPYTPGLWAPAGVQIYIYPPLFLYITTAFYLLPSETLFPALQNLHLSGYGLGFARLGFAFVFFDLATCVIMYAAAKEMTRNPALPVVATLLYGLNPIGLWWGDYVWLSTPIHTFFLVLGFYFMLRQDLRTAAFWIAVATMIKQTAGVLLPVVFFLELARGRRRALTSLGIMAAVMLALSLPYLVLYPVDYLGAIARGMGGQMLGNTLPLDSYPISVSILAFYAPEPLRTIVSCLVYYGVPFGACLALLWAMSLVIPQSPRRTYQTQLAVVALLLSLALHLFFPRGIYKYYLLALVPFLVLFAVAQRGSLLRVPASCPLQTVLDREPLCRLPRSLRLALKDALQRSRTVLNGQTPWWLLLVWLASFAIFTVHRFETPAILLGLFLLVLAYAIYEYIWRTRKARQRRKSRPTRRTGLLARLRRTVASIE